jgi:hypothetical protein
VRKRRVSNQDKKGINHKKKEAKQEGNASKVTLDVTIKDSNGEVLADQALNKEI